MNRDTGEMRRTLVRVMAKVDEAVDDVLYRPAVVKGFRWAPRWWLCDLARLSIVLDDRWKTGYWAEVGIAPGGACEACGRRAAIHVLGGCDDEETVENAVFLDERPVQVCGWCQIRGEINSQEALEVALEEARNYSVSWRWRWRVRP